MRNEITCEHCTTASLGPSCEASDGWIVVIDETTGNFTVEGPSPDVERWKQAVERAQQSGRMVRCNFDPGSRDEAVAQAKHDYGGSEVLPAGAILSISPSGQDKGSPPLDSIQPTTQISAFKLKVLSIFFVYCVAFFAYQLSQAYFYGSIGLRRVGIVLLVDNAFLFYQTVVLYILGIISFLIALFVMLKRALTT